MTIICFVLKCPHGRHAWREGDGFRDLTYWHKCYVVNYISVKRIAVYHADMSSSHPFVALGKMRLFMLFILVFRTVALLRSRMCCKCVDQEVESFILWYVFLRVLMCVSEHCFLMCSLLSQTLTFSINWEGRVVRGTEKNVGGRGIAIEGASPFPSATSERYRKQ